MAIVRRRPERVTNTKAEMPEPTSLQLHREVAEKATRFIKRLHSGVIGAFEFQGGWRTAERVDGIVFNSISSFVIEAKVSRGDFLADKKKEFRSDPSKGMGDFRYYACPEGMIKPEELPEKWGLIYVQDNGQCYLASGFGGAIRTSRTVPWVTSGNQGAFGCNCVNIYHGCHKPEGYYFEEKNEFAEKVCLFFLAKRYKEQKFMENIL